MTITRKHATVGDYGHELLDVRINLAALKFQLAQTVPVVGEIPIADAIVKLLEQFVEDPRNFPMNDYPGQLFNLCLQRAGQIVQQFPTPTQEEGMIVREFNYLILQRSQEPKERPWIMGNLALAAFFMVEAHLRLAERIIL